MKYYIPTTTLNFNNILASESVFPPAFYGRLGFGYPRWKCIPENKISSMGGEVQNDVGMILLYDTFASLDRPAGEMEDHPLVIEIESNEEFFRIADHIFYTPKPLYLNPFQTRFLFFSEEDKKIALSLASTSLETKLVGLYREQFVVEKPKDSQRYPRATEEPDGLNSTGDELTSARFLNTLKGMLYGYYIGSALSDTKERIEKFNILSEMRNIALSVLSNPYKEVSRIQKERLERCCDRYMAIAEESMFQKWRLKEGKNIPRISLDGTISKEEIDEDSLRGFYKYICAHKEWPFSRLHIFSAEEFLYALRDEKENECRAIKWLKKEFAEFEPVESAAKGLLSPDKGEIIIGQDYEKNEVNIAILQDNGEQRLYNAWIEKIVSDQKIDRHISANKEYIAREFTIKARDVMSSAWDKSLECKFLNDLFNFVKGARSSFEQPWQNGLLSSLAAVVLKGEDWRELLTFMRNQGLTDYRLAFSLYGAIHGFANLTRDFTDLLLAQEKSYVEEVYREFHGQLHGLRLSHLNTSYSDIVALNQVDHQHLSYIRNGEPSRHQSLSSEYKSYDKDRGISDMLSSSSSFNMKEDIIKKIKNIYHSKIEVTLSNRDKEERYKNLVRTIEEDWSGIPGFLKKLEEKTGWKGNRSNCYKIMRDALSPPPKILSFPSSCEGADAEIENGMFNKNVSADSKTLLFISDSAAKDTILELAISENIRERCLNSLEKFQRKYSSGFYSEYPEKYSRDNKNTIDHFFCFCFHKTANKNSYLERNNENVRIMKEIVYGLYKRYNVKLPDFYKDGKGRTR